MRSRAKVLFAVVSCLALLALAGAALAAQVYVPAQSFSGPGAEDGQLDKPRRAAIEQASGNLFLADSGNGRVQVFAPDGSFLTSFGQTELDAPFGIAIYESGGETEVYVSDPATNQILRYDSDEAATPSFSVDAGFTSPTAGAGQLKVGDFAAALAVDPNNGDLWVADPGDDRAQRYDSSGAFELANDGSDSPAGAFAGLLDVAVDSSGRVYAIDSDGFIANQPDGTAASGQSRVERFSASGEHQLTLGGLTRPATVAVDLATDQVAVSADQSAVDDNEAPSLHVYDSAGTKLDDLRMGSATQYTTVHGLAWRSSDQDLFSVNDVGYWNGSPNGSPSINRFELEDEPTPAIDSPANVTATSADLSGTVNPGGHTTTARFEISGDGGSSWKELEEISVCEVSSPGDCTADEAVAFTATGLTPNLGHQVRLVAESAIGEVASAVETFTTDEAPPTVKTGVASLRTDESALLSGDVSPNGLATTYYFEYGTAPGTYTGFAPASQDGDAGAGGEPVAVQESLTGLAPGTVYYYRLVAANSQGSSTGSERSFETLPAGEFAPDTYFNTGSFGIVPGGGWGSEPGQFNSPRRLAVHDASGQIYVADQGNARVQVFSPSGGSASHLTEFGEGVLSGPYGIAIGQGSGDVYVADQFAEQIFKFNSDGAATPTLTLDPGFTSPAQGSGPGELGGFAVDIEVDPISGDLVVADSANQRVQRFGSDGTPIPSGSIDGASSPKGIFSAVSDVAVAANGDVIVGTLSTGDPRFERYSPAGAFQQAIPYSGPIGGDGQVEVDPNTGYVLIAMEYGWNERERIQVFDGTELLGEVFLPTTDAKGISGYGVRAGGDGRLYVASDLLFGCCGYTGVFVYEPGALPRVALDPASNLTATSARLTGEVNPAGRETTWRFEYSVDQVHWVPAPFPAVDQSAGDGSTPVSVSAEIAELRPNTTYHLRLIGSSVAGQAVAAGTFTTPAGPPTVAAAGVAPRTTTTARLNARLNPNGLATTYHFEYGTDAGYGSRAPLVSELSAGGGESVLASAEVQGLAPATTYHYRLVAESSAGTTVGEDRTFSTRTAAEMTPPSRGIELVSNPDKANQALYFSETGPTASRAVWGTVAGAPGSESARSMFWSIWPSSSPYGWEGRSVYPPIAQFPSDVSLSNDSLVGGSTDLESLVLEGSREDGGRVIFRARDTGFEQVHVRSAESRDNWDDVLVPRDADSDRLFIVTKERLDPDHEAGLQVYDVGGGSPELATRLPGDDQPADCDIRLGEEFLSFQPYTRTSSDGSRLFFNSPGPSCLGPSNTYMRDLDTDTTVEVAGTPESGPDASSFFIRANPQGTAAVLTTLMKLAPEDSNTGRDIYLWRDTGEYECLTCIVPRADVAMFGVDEGKEPSGSWRNSIVVSENLSTVYFMSEADLIPALAIKGTKLYALRGEVLRFVAPIGDQGRGALGPTTHITPNGDVLTFNETRAAITGDPADGGLGQVFRYSFTEDAIECLTCGGQGQAYTAFLPNKWEPHFYAEGMSADGGTVALATRTKLLPEDVNGSSDIYEWRNGNLRLVTDGRIEFPQDEGSPSIESVSRDGSGIFFRSSAHYTGHEIDGVGQLFIARTGGGSPPPVAPPSPCDEDDCQGPLTQPPVTQGAASARFTGPGNVGSKPSVRKQRCPKGKRRTGGKARCGKVRKKDRGAQGKSAGRVTSKTGRGK